MGSTTQPSRIMISLEVASMVGFGGGRWRDSVRVPRKKTDSRAASFLSHLEDAKSAKIDRDMTASRDSLEEKAR